MTSPGSLRQQALDILGGPSYVVLGTADADGNPWTTPVWFAPDGLRRLFWVSWPGSRHSRLLEHRQRVGLTVFDTHVAPHEGAAFYATADARLCPEDELDDGLAVYGRRSAEQGLPAFTRGRLSGGARLRLYVADYTETWVLEQDSDVDERVAVPRGGPEDR